MIHEGRQYVSVTSAMGLVKWLLNEPDDYTGINAYDMRRHQLEGTACHAVALDWLAQRHGLVPDHTVPVWPSEHGDERRWQNVLYKAQVNFQEFCQQYDVEPIGIEQESFSSAYGLVGHLDLHCLLRWKRSRVKAVVDLKFVANIMESHRLQVRCYGRLDGFKDSQIGLLFHSSRTTGIWKVDPVDLRSNLDDVAAVANAARLWAWAEGRK